MRNINVSKKENIKNSSNYLAGEIAKQLSEKSSYFKEEEVQLLKFHGTYQQFNRDTGTELKQKGLEKEFYFMIRTKVPGGILSAKQYIDFDNISNQFSNKSLRITTRQTFQFHGVIKGNIKNIIRFKKKRRLSNRIMKQLIYLSKQKKGWVNPRSWV